MTIEFEILCWLEKQKRRRYIYAIEAELAINDRDLVRLLDKMHSKKLVGMYAWHVSITDAGRAWIDGYRAALSFKKALDEPEM